MTTQLHYSNDQAAYAEIYRRDASHVVTFRRLTEVIRSGLGAVQSGSEERAASRAANSLLDALVNLQVHLETQEDENRKEARG